MSVTAEIFVVTGPGPGHLHPCTELCLQLTRRSYRSTLVIPSYLSYAIPSSFASNPRIAVAQIARSSRPPVHVSDPLNEPADHGLSALLENRTAGSDQPRVLCAVVDLKVLWTKEVFRKFDVPVISFFTLGACAAAMALGVWRAQASDVRPGEARLIPGLPQEMAEIFVVTGPGPGHLHPCMELCLQLTRRSYRTTLVIPKYLSSAIPSSLASNPLITVAKIAGPSRPDPLNQPADQGLSAHLENRTAGSDRPRVLCAVVDLKMSWTKEVFRKFNVPVISFFVYGACAAAMPLGVWKAQASDVQPGEARLIPGLPKEMAVTYSDLKRKPFRNPRGGGHVPTKPGDQPYWVRAVEGSIGLIFNSCADLERPFLDYVRDQMKMPVWGGGPLLPEQYWQTSHSLISEREIRQPRCKSNCTEDEVIKWLDGKPPHSVLYVAFGSEVGLEEEELAQLADALEELTRAFIWVIGSTRYKGDLSDSMESRVRGMESRVGDRGLIIRRWAPQLLILSHPSTGGFLSHCGWNSTAEAIGRGVPLLAWPMLGDQHYNAKLVVSHLKVGYRVAEDMSRVVKKEEIVKGIERLMCDEEIRKRAASINAKFGNGFPTSSSALDAFADFINSKL